MSKKIPFAKDNVELHPHYTLARLYSGNLIKDWDKIDLKKSYLYLKSGCESKIGFYDMSCLEQIEFLIDGRGVNKDVKKAAKIAYQLFIIEDRKKLFTDLMELLSSEEEFSTYFNRFSDEDTIPEPEEVTLNLAILMGASNYLSENINDLPQAKNDILEKKKLKEKVKVLNKNDLKLEDQYNQISKR